ncbi:MAG: MBL fold metallo-hydrolase [Bdellovibrionaceae bacterium]|nr:MBL fold metallo-hydrolase [Pseudobdellovibrionaceae bacterium]
MDIQTTKLKIGPYEVCPIPTGIFGLDGGAMFGTVPKVLWEKTNPADEKNRIAMEARALLLKSPGCNVLIDTGNGGDFIAKYGEKLGSKFAEMYNINSEGPLLHKSLARHGLTVEDIHHVILTHLHFDHAGGGTTERGGKLVPTFPRATYWLQRANLETAQKPNLREKASYFSANYQPLLDAGCLKIIDGGQSLLPGISVMVSNGHTRGQQIVLVADEKQKLLYCGDVVPTSTHVRIPWLMGYDLYPLELMEEKNSILGRAADEGWWLFFEHDPYCDVAKIERNAGDFRVTGKYWLQ